ncbi:MAG: NAD-dependent epimerase/dehydratase family protein [Paludibacter sp.]|jgi:nucleoside-diphosphate-sugar epimerase|nr:NAD-dependent epimerase/dehydratase family protein [Paludibacter sp.]
MKTLLLTGANGFLGRNILPLLRETYHVATLDLQNADYVCDVSKNIFEITKKIDIVLHAVGKAHIVPKTAIEKQAFFDVNLQGTVNLCNSLEQSGTIPKSFIFISTVAVYGYEFGENVTENAPLNGTSPYALSKIQAEKYLIEWCAKNKVILSIFRPSLIAGANPPGNLGAMINGIKNGKYLRISKGTARKSVLMVQDIATLVLLAADKGGIFNVCSDEQPSFYELEQLIVNQLHKSTVLTMPMWVARIAAKIGDVFKISIFNSQKLEKITSSLTFSNEKAKSELAWKPINVLENFRIF